MSQRAKADACGGKLVDTTDRQTFLGNGLVVLIKKCRDLPILQDSVG